MENGKEKGLASGNGFGTCSGGLGRNDSLKNGNEWVRPRENHGVGARMILKGASQVLLPQRSVGGTLT